MNSAPTALLFGSVAILSVLLSVNSAADEGIRFERTSDSVFLNCEDLANRLDLDFKIVTAQRLVTFCQRGAGGICIPVRLNAVNHVYAGEEVLIAADTLASALRFRVFDVGKKVTISRQLIPANGSLKYETPAYNTAWEEGRGFRQGDTLPDIPLVDLQGNEVRFAQFLGKRYILYCWASW